MNRKRAYDCKTICKRYRTKTPSFDPKQGTPTDGPNTQSREAWFISPPAMNGYKVSDQPTLRPRSFQKCSIGDADTMKPWIILFLFTCLFLAFCRPAQAEVTVDDFDSVRLYTLSNDHGMTVKVTNFGATITAIIVPDRDGKFADVVLGYDSLKDYLNAIEKPYFGAIVGRYGNRIAKGQFTIAGETSTLATNNGDNHLHGGYFGFDKVVWEAQAVSGKDWSGVELSYLSRDGEEGYPGNLQVKVTYQLLLKSNRLIVEYDATTDKATPINLTQHSYFNLKGEGEGNILDHQLMLNAKSYTPVDQGGIPTGTLAKVADTPFDFTTPKPIGQDIQQDHQQLEFGLGYDHNFVIEGKQGTMRLAARVYEPTSGRTLEVHTLEPGIQFYCGNFLNGKLKGKSRKPYVHRGGFCLETQHYPDSPNHPNFPSSILRPGEKYLTKTIFQFSTN